MKLSSLAPLKLACLLLAVASVAPASLAARTIVSPGEESIWKYLDTSAGPDTAWMQAGFDDSQWKSGKAPIGFGETRIGTTLESKPLAAWFRREFDAPELRAGEGLVILLCVDDGAVVYLNGRELGRPNMPDGPVAPATMALRTIAEDDEGFYQRLHVPADALRAGAKNVLAVSVHNISSKSSDLYFDLALKTVPAEARPEVAAHAGEVVMTFNKRHYLGPEVKIPDGYIDGGRHMKIDATGHAASGREILSVDRARDTELADDLAFARSEEIRALPELERVRRIAGRIDRETTPFGGLDLVDRTTEELEEEFAGKALMIGDWMDQCHAGVCRHRSLLFKLLGDEAGLKTALVRGNFIKKKPPGFAHAWNEVILEDGRRLLVDVMHNGGTATFRELTDPYVIKHYGKVDDTPWYGGKAGK